MSSRPDINNFFLGVALVVNRSRDGPAFVFHYPPYIQSAVAARASACQEQSQNAELGDMLLERLSHPTHEDFASSRLDGGADGTQLSKHLQLGEHVMTESGSQIVPWEHVAGFPARDLAGIFTPARSYHKKLFQLTLDPLCCVSCPIHVPESGKWRKSKKAGKGKPAKSAEDQELGPQDIDVPQAEATDQPKEVAAGSGEKAEIPATEEEKRSSMTMFNLVFLLDHKHSGLHEWVSMLHSNIIKKVNKAFKYSQQHSDFVWKDSKRILSAKDKGREERRKMSELWADILQSSSLAASIRQLYEAISRNKIAILHLDTATGVLSPSVQMPVPFYVCDVPREGDEKQRGLWLTTAHSFLSQDAIEEPGFLDRNFALLLMDDPKRIVAELQADRDPATNSLIEFVRLSKPTMSFWQVGQSNAITLGQVRKYAQHFIFWRRALAIPPIHGRDVYILSPNCDLTRLPQASQEWQRAFPFAPPLSSFLVDLSTSPRPYKSHCPSKSYRPIYLQMLSWLMRGGWVTQLCTFAYVVVWPEILYEVDYEMEAEELGTAAEPDGSQGPAASSGPTIITTAAGEVDDDDEENGERAPTSSTTGSAGGSAAAATTGPDSKASFPSAVPSTTEHTAERARLERIALKAHREAADKATAHARRIGPVATAHPAVNDAPHLEGLTPHIILDANKATGKESRYLAAIAHRFTDERVKAAWQAMCKYFDGRCALERIALQEDRKRKETWTLLTAMSEHLLCVRHW